MAGGKRGLTVPAGFADPPGPVYVCEGASDVLALTAAGLCAVGRPNNRGGAGFLAVLLDTLAVGREVVVLGENDEKPGGQWPGRDGMRAVAAALRRARPDRVIRAMLPPPDAKDARAWLTHADRAGVPWPDRGAAFAAGLVRDEPDPPAAPPAAADVAGSTPDRPWPNPIDEAAYVGLLAEYVKLVAPDTGRPRRDPTANAGLVRERHRPRVVRSSRS